MRPFLAILPALAGCVTYAQHRAAFVPHATPIPHDGQPLEGQGEAALGAVNIADLRRPTAGADNVGDAVPNTTLRGELDMRVTHDFAIGVVHERGLEATARPVTTSQPPVNGGDVGGTGVNFQYSLKLGASGWRLGLATEILFWAVPWVQYTTCISDNCPVQGWTTTSDGTDVVPTLATSVTPSYRSGRFTLFGGVTLRNHPTIPEKIETVDPNSDADVQAGPYNVTLHGGASVELGAGIRALLFVHQTVTIDPIRYWPGVGLMLSIPLGRDANPT
jgi:hypothetical protein